MCALAYPTKPQGKLPNPQLIRQWEAGVLAAQIPAPAPQRLAQVKGAGSHRSKPKAQPQPKPCHEHPTTPSTSANGTSSWESSLNVKTHAHTYNQGTTLISKAKDRSHSWRHHFELKQHALAPPDDLHLAPLSNPTIAFSLDPAVPRTLGP